MFAAIVIAAVLIGLFAGSTLTVSIALYLEKQSKMRYLRERFVWNYAKKHDLTYAEAYAQIHNLD